MPVQRVAYRMEGAAEALSISRTAMYQLAKERRIQTIKIGRRTLVPVSEVNALVARLLERVPEVA